ncbi:MAG TPA: hypothetical protein VHK01_13730 [Lacipirellulaceae bacterium]|nr:hypothetical protein [Lacipirellulaceae bacterium]
MRKYTTSVIGSLILAMPAALGMALTATSVAVAQISKGHQILIERGLQTQGMVTKDDVFHLDTYRQANYSAINWLWDSSPSQHGPAPGFPWARWVRNENQMPSTAEQPYLSQLIALQLGDEWHLNDPAVRDRAVNWFNAIRDQWPDTILYMNSFGGQVNDAALADFVSRARPDMLCFDTYPWKSTYVPPGPGESQGHAGTPLGGQPTSWYGDLRRYRVHALNAGLPLGAYRQTFHAVQDYDQTVYRDPSPSELNLNTFGALAFGATTLIDFTYNTGASSLFTNPGGDSNPTPLYHEQTAINRQARSLGKSLVHLVALDNHPNGGQPTVDIMFHRGKTGPNATDVTPLPIGFTPDNASPNTFSEWEARRNDPYMSGWTVTNLGTRNGGLRGDVIISWFKPLDATNDDANLVDDQLYFMIVNGFAGPDGMAADYRQRITVNFFNNVTPSLQRINPETGEAEAILLEVIPGTGGRRRLNLELDGGKGELFKFNTGHAFLGTNFGLSGDFNGDGNVDAADYVTWRKGLGTVYNAAAYDVWRRNFGASSALGSAVIVPAGMSSVVPEPAATILMAHTMFVVTACCYARRRRN